MTEISKHKKTGLLDLLCDPIKTWETSMKSYEVKIKQAEANAKQFEQEETRKTAQKAIEDKIKADQTQAAIQHTAQVKKSDASEQ